MNLNTTYLGLELRSPLVVSALPLSRNIENIKQMEAAGAGAIVLFSLFQEQVRIEQRIHRYYQENPRATPADALSLFPLRQQFEMGLNEYAQHIRKAKEAVNIPIVASLNCASLGLGSEFAQQIEAAGADALELNIYHIPANMDRTAAQIEDMYLTMVRVLKSAIRIPVAVKLVPFFTNTAALARQLHKAGADGLVLFNRFYQPDFDPETLRLSSEIPLGKANDARLTMHWIAILYGYVKADLAATGGIYTAVDVVKMLMVGAQVTMLASALLQNGINHIQTIENDLTNWLDRNDYTSIQSIQGILRQFHSRDAGAFERGEYVRAVSKGNFVEE